MTIAEAAALLPPDASLEALVEVFSRHLLADEALTVEEAAAELKVGRSTIYKFMLEGLPWEPVRHRGRRIYRQELHAWFRGRRDHARTRRSQAQALRSVGSPPKKCRRGPAAMGAAATPALDVRGGTDRDSLLALVRDSRRASKS